MPWYGPPSRAFKVHVPTNPNQTVGLCVLIANWVSIWQKSVLVKYGKLELKYLKWIRTRNFE